MNWDDYFLEVCNTVAKNSKCLSRQIGAILVSDKSIVTTGYNGPPAGVPHCHERHKIDGVMIYEMRDRKIIWNEETDEKRCPRYVLGYKSGEGLHLYIAGHAERNVLINAAKEGISTKGKILYMSCGVPCTPCLVEIINAGISEIVITKMTFYDPMSEYLLKYSNLKVREYGR